jgi:hypothetical protein
MAHLSMTILTHHCHDYTPAHPIGMLRVCPGRELDYNAAVSVDHDVAPSNLQSETQMRKSAVTRFRWLMLYVIFIVGALTISACQGRGLTPEDLPTLIPEADVLATQQIQTQNAPPLPYRERVTVPRLDDGLDALAGYHYVAEMRFEGVFSGTSRPASGYTRTEVWYRALGTQRRVVVDAGGDFFGGEELTRVEGVRLGSDVFAVQDNVCRELTGTSIAFIADLSVGDLIGGVREAIPAGQVQTINGERVWRYAFLQDALNLSGIQQRDNSRISFLSGELWFAPDHAAVVRFYLVMGVENAAVFGTDTAPVTGQVIMQYDLYDIGVEPNISVPFGC